MRRSGAGRRLLGRHGFRPAVSPDGNWVAYVGCLRCWQTAAWPSLYVVSTSGGKPRLLVPHVDQPEWTPDSRRILVKTGTGFESVDPKSGKATLLAHGGVLGWSFSADGLRMAYSWSRLNTNDFCKSKLDVYTQPLVGGPRVRLTTDGHATLVVWGSDELVFGHFDDCKTAATELWLVRPDGSGLRRLASATSTGSSGLFPVAWHGATLLAQDETFDPDTVVVDPTTGTYRTIARGWAPEALSRDGRTALVERSSRTRPNSFVLASVNVADRKLRAIPRVYIQPQEVSWNG